MKQSLLVAAAVALALGAGGAFAAPAAGLAVQPSGGQFIDGVYRPGDQPAFEKAQFIYGGRNYCWYEGGWRGPGWYWCGYASRRGFGWGGPVGWNGWARGGPGPGWRHEGWRGRGWHRGWRHHHQGGWRDRR